MGHLLWVPDYCMKGVWLPKQQSSHISDYQCCLSNGSIVSLAPAVSQPSIVRELTKSCDGPAPWFSIVGATVMAARFDHVFLPFVIRNAEYISNLLHIIKIMRKVFIMKQNNINKVFHY